MSDFINNYNDHFTYSHAYQNTYRGSGPGNKLGKIVNVTRESHLAQSYDVELLKDGAFLKGVRFSSAMGGFNGTGAYSALEEGTLVLVSSNEGMLDDCYIVGLPFLEGTHKDYYQDGKLAKPGELATLGSQQLEFNQPFGHPNRITQPDGYFNVFGGKNVTSDFSSPEFFDNIEDKAKANPTPASIEMRNPMGDLVQYTLGSNITYSDSNIISVSAGNNETKCTKLMRSSAYHQKRADLYSGLNKAIPSTIESVGNLTGIKPLVDLTLNTFATPSLRSPFSIDYLVQQEKKLAALYREAAQACNQGDTARQQQVSKAIDSVGSELPNSNQTTLQGQKVAPNYKPKESNSVTNPNGYGERINPKHKPLIVLHETDSTAINALSYFQNPQAKVSYHAVINLDGNITYLTNSKQRAFAAACSEFNGEYELVEDSKSVDNFSYHISLETPPSGLEANKTAPTHTGYTEAQYMSCVWLCSQTGVPPNRITTHKYIDIAKVQQDPRSFNRDKFDKLLTSYPITKKIYFSIPGEEDYVKSLNTPASPISINPDSIDIVYNYKEASSLVTSDNGIRLHPDAAKAFKTMQKAASQEGVSLYLVSGFRSIASQQKIWDDKKAKGQSDTEIKRVSAVPGRSEHHTGYAMDLDDGNNKTNLETTFDSTKAYKWLKTNANKFYFENSYPNLINRDNITYEPWHWRFFGTTDAKIALHLTT